MPDSTVLVVSRDASLVGWLEYEVERISDLRIEAVDDVEVACVRATRDGIGLIVIHVMGEVGVGEVSQILWASSTLRRVVPVVAMSERYQTERAVTLFQLGVADYLSRSHHRNRLRDVIDALTLRPSQRSASPAEGALVREPNLLSAVS